MTVTAKALIPGKYAATTVTAEYTVPGSTKTIIDKFTALNSDGSAATVSIYIVPSGQAASNSNRIINAKSIGSLATYDFTELKNHVMSAGEAIHVIAGTATAVSIRASGREVT